MEDLFQRVAERGWSEDRRNEFVQAYDRMIGQAIVYYLARYWHLERREIGELLSGVERRTRGKGETPEHPLLESLEEAYLELYKQVFQGKLIPGYVQGKREGKIQADFASYLRGIIRHRVLDCLRKRMKDEQKLINEADWEEQLPSGSFDWAKGLRASWWDRLIRCRPSEASERKQLQRTALSLDEEAAARTTLCFACAELKAEAREAEKEDLRMFLVYYLSNHGSALPAAWRELPTLDDLSLERIRGLALSWQEIFQMFGRQCNPSRIRAELRDRWEALVG